MKTRTIFTLILCITLVICTLPDSFSGQASSMVKGTEMPDTVPESSARTDTTSIAIGNRQILIVEKDGKTDITIFDRTKPGPHITKNKRPVPFKGNWRGLELGLNNYVNNNFSTSLGPEDDFMELRNARSFNVNLNILQYNFALSDNNIGFVSGLGLEYNNYRFSNDLTITKENREIVPVDYSGVNLNKTRFRAVYLNVPLLLEFQTKHPSRNRRAYFSAGVIGGVNIGSNTKVVYRDNSGRGKEKVKDDFYLSPFRYGLSFRTGFRALNLYANYYPTSLFQSNKGPELYPVAVGLSIFGF
jgi:hypothetical protein